MHYCNTSLLFEYTKEIQEKNNVILSENKMVEK